MSQTSHSQLRESILTRIKSGEWQLGERIPDETALADEYGCARTTVNRALQALAKEGLLVRKRKGGTRVCQMPVRQAKFEIPIVREQIEDAGKDYRHKVVSKKSVVPPANIRSRLKLPASDRAFYLETLFLGSGKAFAFEQRWVNLQAAPEILEAPLDDISANEWLVKSVPFSSAQVAFSATNASACVAKVMDVELGRALFTVDRTTWLNEVFITAVQLHYYPGYQLTSEV
ncbi:MAG: GntR family transcriptional regulator [Lysobacterales bacterium]